MHEEDNLLAGLLLVGSMSWFVAERSYNYLVPRVSEVIEKAAQLQEKRNREREDIPLQGDSYVNPAIFAKRDRFRLVDSNGGNFGDKSYTGKNNRHCDPRDNRPKKGLPAHLYKA